MSKAFAKLCQGVNFFLKNKLKKSWKEFFVYLCQEFWLLFLNVCLLWHPNIYLMWKQWVIVFYPGLSLDDTNLCLTYDSQHSCSLSISVSLSLSLGQSLDHGPKSTWSPWQCLWESRWSYHAIPLRVHQNQQPTGWTAVRTLSVITGLMSKPHCSLWLFVLYFGFSRN